MATNPKPVETTAAARAVTVGTATAEPGTIAAFVLHVIPIRGGNLFQCRRRANRL